MKPKAHRITINDLAENAAANLSAEDVARVRGGAVKLENVQITSYQLGVLSSNDETPIVRLRKS